MANQTYQAAEAMLGNGWYSSARLGRDLGISAKVASGILYNIRHGSRYQVRETALPNRLVMVVAIDGRKARNADLWRIALFSRRAA